MSKLMLSLLMLIPSFSFDAWAEEKRLVVLGDSLTEGYGVAREEAFPAVLQKKITAAGKKWVVVNSGVSGSTSASAVSRLNWILKQKPDLLLVELGANDALRALPPKEMEKNLTAALKLAQKNGVKTILLGMKVPPNYGQEYAREFEAVFPRLAARFKVPLIPFFLEPVAGKPELNQADGIHPTAKGHVLIADGLYQALEKYL